MKIHPELTGYYPGAIGQITELHARYYHERWGFDITFETQVGRELSAFMSEFDKGRDGLWLCMASGAFAGSVAICGSRERKEGARLRWFIVKPEFQGRGLGRVLLKTAIDFCRERGLGKIFLWTFRGLDSARHLYEKEGFRLAAEKEVGQWGRKITEQKFELILESIHDSP